MRKQSGCGSTDQLGQQEEYFLTCYYYVANYVANAYTLYLLRNFYFCHNTAIPFLTHQSANNTYKSYISWYSCKQSAGFFQIVIFTHLFCKHICSSMGNIFIVLRPTWNYSQCITHPVCNRGLELRRWNLIASNRKTGMKKQTWIWPLSRIACRWSLFCRHWSPIGSKLELFWQKLFL